MEKVTVTGGTGTLGTNPIDGRPELSQGLRIALATGQLRRPLRETLRPVLDLLSDGDYTISEPQRLAEFLDLVPTEPWPPADEARVAYYRAAIRTGHKPVAVILETTIVDGHHKIAAYRAENTEPWVVRISQYSAS
ncbi:hypothetical protein [Amycolatopsis suaedae]|uniref:Uncharacterized protein n=1 Tax=Amycolatopsis suaedae TaxID=2510978 RepID=A0A4Q7JBV0_9PSEU|nr:hypothetical protein [Amycolatopsis suaedae]RZQ65311.1 hypothetical protein EWH70_05375 [Amycolatopsis suaedae]